MQFLHQHDVGSLQEQRINKITSGNAFCVSESCFPSVSFLSETSFLFCLSAETDISDIFGAKFKSFSMCKHLNTNLWFNSWFCRLFLVLASWGCVFCCMENFSDAYIRATNDTTVMIIMFNVALVLYNIVSLAHIYIIAYADCWYHSNYSKNIWEWKSEHIVST